MLEEIVRSLQSISVPGSFAIRATTLPGDLILQVKDVGVIRFPVSPTQARKLCAVARRAGFGRRDQTLVDTTVRDTWEIASSRVKIDRRRWNRTLGPQLEQIKQDLGLPAHGRLDARLYKLLVYEPGQFFVAHQDSEKADDMIGTLTVALPSAYTGGSVEIEHRGEKVTYRRSRRSSEQLTFIAFYADCHHQVRPIKDGYRLVLVYNLFFDGPALSLRGPSDEASIDSLAGHVDAHFTTPVSAGRFSQQAPAPPDKLVYLLDHDYTQKSLDWDRLKNGDASRAAALRTVAARLDCEIYLVLADVQETWLCEDEGYGWGYSRYRDDDDDADGEAYSLIELSESNIELRHWLDASGRPVKSVPSGVGWDEVCFTKATDELEPFESQHEGWMGNYGNTVDRWYHRAAVVMWPRSRSFYIRAKISPAWAVDELIRLLKTSALEEGREKARSLLAFWDYGAAQESGKTFLSKTLRLARSLEDPNLSASLLAPFGLGQLGAQSIPQLVGLLECYGLSWCRDRFLQWETAHDRYRTDHRKAWLQFMPDFCRTLCSGGGGPGMELAHWVVSRQWSVIKEECKAALKDSENPYALAQLSVASERILYVLESCVAVNGRDVHADMVAFLTAADTRFPVRSLVAALRAGRKRYALNDLNQMDLGALLLHCMTILTAKLAEPVRAADDWSITSSRKCNCELCKTLDGFLLSRDEARFEWPLAQANRAHVHRQIDKYGLPVSHVTQRRGRPYTLVLVKLNELFTREAELRKALRSDLAWLKRQQRCFA